MEAQTDLADIDRLWSDFFDDVLDASQRRAVLANVTSEFNVAVVRGPGSASLLETLGRVYSERPLTETMWPAAERALSMAYGRSATRLISWLLDDFDLTEQRLGEIAPMLEQRAEIVLREILARHAEDLGWSAYASNNSAQEWRTIDIDRTQSLGGRNYFMRLTVNKVNGERIAFESRANQLLVLARAILDTLNALPPAAFTVPQVIESFLEQAQRIVNSLSAALTASQEQTPTGATNGSKPDEAQGLLIDDGTAE